MNQTPQLSKADLNRLVRGLPPGGALVSREYELSLRIIAGFLGRDWLTGRFQAGQGGLSGPLPEAEDGPARAGHIHQVVEFAEMLLNLQFVVGFEHCLKQLHEPDIAAGHAGLEVGRLIHACQMELQYTAEACVLEMRPGPGGWLRANAQAKLAEDAAASADLIHDLLAAATRLPADRPCFIFLQFPASWTADRLALLDQGAAKFLKDADPRVASVKTFATAHTGPKRDLTFAIKEYDNATSSFARPAGWTLFTEPRRVRWRYLRGL